MASIIGLYGLIDVASHKGQARVLFPKNYPQSVAHTGPPTGIAVLINSNKDWKKGVNSKMQLEELPANTSGFEVDIYFDSSGNYFDVHHDLNKSTGLHFESLMEIYQQRKLTAAIWIDIKNLNKNIADSALRTLIQLRHKYGLEHKILIESHQASLLTAFNDSGFYTSLYVPMFNPYRMSDASLVFWADSIGRALESTKVNAISGYYFQMAFLKHYFPDYALLTWIENDSRSLINLIFKARISGDESIHIVLKP